MPNSPKSVTFKKFTSKEAQAIETVTCDSLPKNSKANTSCQAVDQGCEDANDGIVTLLHEIIMQATVPKIKDPEKAMADLKAFLSSRANRPINH